MSKDLPRIVSSVLAQLIPAKVLHGLKSPEFLPFYHLVSEKRLPHVQNYPYPDPEAFEKELDYILKYYIPVSLDELYHGTASKGKKIFHLSFDDGLKECAEIIAPILLRKGIPATFFINSSFVDNKKLFHRYKASLILHRLTQQADTKVIEFLNANSLSVRNLLHINYSDSLILDQASELMDLDFSNYLENDKPYMSMNQVKWLNDVGFSIGGHSHEHPEFWLISETKQLHEVQMSMNWLEESLSPTIKAFAFPYTDHGVSQAFLSQLHAKNICDISFGTAGIKGDQTKSHYQRYPVEQSGSFHVNLKSELLYYQFRKLIGKGTVRH